MNESELKEQQGRKKDIPIPEFIQDIDLIKLFLPPLELYTLKYFLLQGHPITIREIYSQTIFFLYMEVIGKQSRVSRLSDRMQNLVVNLVSSGYGEVVVDRKVAVKIDKENALRKNVISETELTEDYIKSLKKCKSKIPSYDRFKTIVERFEDMGLIVKVAKEGKAILYTLNPKFYKATKEIKEEILKL